MFRDTLELSHLAAVGTAPHEVPLAETLPRVVFESGVPIGVGTDFEPTIRDTSNPPQAIAGRIVHDLSGICAKLFVDRGGFSPIYLLYRGPRT
jgi:hypothetical protein